MTVTGTESAWRPVSQKTAIALFGLIAIVAMVVALYTALSRSPSIVPVSTPQEKKLPDADSHKALLAKESSQIHRVFDVVEAAVAQGGALLESDLSGFSLDELRLLRNTVYARHGRLFNDPNLQQHFERRSSYVPRSTYSVDNLTPRDRANIRLIQKQEKRQP